MIVDYLNITAPPDGTPNLYRTVLGLLGQSGFRQVNDQLWRGLDGGTCRISDRNGVVVYSASGETLEALRHRGLYEDYLWAFAEGPHRVTKMDIACDLRLETPPILQQLWQKAHSADGVKLTRKRIPSKSIEHVVGLDARGIKTGTLYLGKRTAECYLKVYDKRHQLECTRSLDIGHPLTRFEVTLTNKLGITLKDAYDPEPVFSHFVGHLMPYPFDCEPWQPGESGFEAPARLKSLPAERLKRLVEASEELRSFVHLADEIGPRGSEYLLSLLRRRVSSVSTDEPLAPVKTTFRK